MVVEVGDEWWWLEVVMCGGGDEGFWGERERDE